MDIDIARWILEFLIRQPWLDDRTVNSLIRVLPFEDNNSSLKKGILLRKLESEISNGAVSEEILGFLEQIEELEHREGNEVLESMKKAYCAVSVDCTVRFLEGGEVDKERKYFDAVKRIWRGRVSEMERFEMGVGLISEGLKNWRDEIEAGVWDLGVCENVLARSRGVNALEAVRQYVDDARDKMGPSFLEVMAETVSDDMVRQALGWGIDGVSDRGRESAPSVSNAGQDVVTNNGNKEMHKGRVSHRGKHVAIRRPRKPVSNTFRGVKIVDTEELVREPSSDRYRCVPTPEANRIQEALESSSLELKAVVNDPLPDALRLAETVISDMARENIVHEPVVGNQNRLDDCARSSFADRRTDALQADDENLGNGCTEKNNGPKPSLMERNSTARIVEWDDSIDSSAEASRRGPHLPSPKKRVTSPLKKYEVPKLSRRRKIKRWSTLEEDTLRTAVQKYGKGQWKLILNMYPDIFEERTEVDLKDKWRNLVRY